MGGVRLLGAGRVIGGLVGLILRIGLEELQVGTLSQHVQNFG